jgi:hypothetical protein
MSAPSNIYRVIFDIHGSSLIKLLLIILAFIFLSAGQMRAQDSLRFSGQLSSWLNINPAAKLPLWINGRYIPQADLKFKGKSDGLFDSEVSVNLYGNAAFHPFDSAYVSGKVKPYRAWIRYSSDQFEIRLGLQKINFGSASILRPLMWFDQIDPRDPLQLTDGVWALLGRYYFLSNVNIWVWGLYGNNKPRGWEPVPVNKKIPEFGGRIQIPVPGGEAAFSYHHRVADNRGMTIFDKFYDKIPEDRFGIDAKWDLNAGLWIESSWTRKWKNIGTLTNEELFNAGIDYTFGVGNGLYMAYEQLIVSTGTNPFEFRNNSLFSLVTANYPVGLFDRFTGIVYFNWTTNKIYNFLSWQRQYDRITIYLMGYLNPETVILPASSFGNTDLFSGKGIQLMFVFNH